jgi:5-hydroxyisourate hydrolase
MGRLTTHVLDTAAGHPAAGLTIDLYRHEGTQRSLLLSVKTNEDGRVEGPLLADDALAKGRYELVFHAADYLRASGTALPDIPFFDEIVIAFGIDEADQHYHVPLLLSPYGYSTYRGS